MPLLIIISLWAAHARTLCATQLIRLKTHYNTVTLWECILHRWPVSVCYRDRIETQLHTCVSGWLSLLWSLAAVAFPLRVQVHTLDSVATYWAHAASDLLPFCRMHFKGIPLSQNKQVYKCFKIDIFLYLWLHFFFFTGHVRCHKESAQIDTHKKSNRI